MKDALLLVNMGGPAHADVAEVRDYLRAIFRDGAILPISPTVRYPLASFISSRRAPKVTERYRQIGGGSPLLHWTRRQAEVLARVLREEGLVMPVHYAFRYTSPTLEEAIADLHRQGIGRIGLLPLFPHYTAAMTGSVVEEALRVARPLGIDLCALNAWGSHDAVITLWQDYLTEAVREAGNGAYVLFVAHGIPERNVKRGEDYPFKVMDSALKIAAVLPEGVRWSVAFQSKVGPVAWTRPYLEDELARLCQAPKPLVIMPLSFAADCLETLYDLDLVARDEALKRGVPRMVRVRAFNDDPRFAQALAQLIHEESHVC